MDNTSDILYGNVEQNEYPIGTRYSVNPLLTGLILGQEMLVGAPLRIGQKALIDKKLNNFVIENNVPDIYTNALRHRGGSALFANGLLNDAVRARYWGNVKEIKDLLTNSENDTPTDLSNNELGRRLAEENKGLSQNDLLKTVYEDIKYNPEPPLFLDTPFMQSVWNDLY